MRSRYILLFFMMLHLCAFVHGQKVANKICDYETLFKEAQNRVKKSDYDTALLVFNSARRCDPSKAEVIDKEIAELLEAIRKQNDDFKKEQKKTAKLSQGLKKSVDLLELERKGLKSAKDSLETLVLQLESFNRRLEQTKADLQNSYESLDVSQQLEQVNDLQMVGMELVKKREYSSALSQFEDAKRILVAISKPLPVLSIKRNLIDTLIVNTQKELDKKIQFNIFKEQIDESILGHDGIPDFKTAYQASINAFKLRYSNEEIKAKVIELNGLWQQKEFRKAYHKKDRVQEIEALTLAIEANDYLEICEFSEKINDLVQLESKIPEDLIRNENIKQQLLRYQNAQFREAGILLGVQQFLPFRFNNDPFIQFNLDGKLNSRNIFPSLPSIFFEFSIPVPKSRKFQALYRFFVQPFNDIKYNIVNLNQIDPPSLVPTLAYSPRIPQIYGVTCMGGYEFFKSKKYSTKVNQFSIQWLLGANATFANYNDVVPLTIRIPYIDDQSFNYSKIIDGFVKNGITPTITATSYFGQLKINPFRLNPSHYDLTIEMEEVFWSSVNIVSGFRLEHKISTNNKLHLFGEVLTYFNLSNDLNRFNLQNEFTRINQLERIFRENFKTPTTQLLNQYETFMKANNDIDVQLDGSKWFVSDLSANIGLIYRF